MVESPHDKKKRSMASGCYHVHDVMQVAQHLLGCSQPLQAITRHVISIYSEKCQDHNLTETAVRNMIIDLATRKSFAAKDSKSLRHLCTSRSIESFPKEAS